MTIFYLNKVLYTNKEGYNSLALLFNQIIHRSISAKKPLSHSNSLLLITIQHLTVI